MMVAFFSGIGGGELLVIFIIFLMLFGSKKLPGIARSLGKTMADLHRAAREVREEFLNADRELNVPSLPANPLPGASSGYGEWHPDTEGYDGEGGMPDAEAAASEPAAIGPSPDPTEASSPAAPIAGEESGTAAPENVTAPAVGDIDAGGGAAPVAGGGGTGDDGANRQV